ncbi:CPBP family intramembrane glutamic endopeptidase [Aneurinibacillus terranovensis]|uniref:CPBP family intramembrane glutamic endopeptidase n=1 Tax=Aneurinibacillus terranovensis TaxID=278991 RepID=UPI000408DCFD|nr:CPBP family intramembrane glutamic endopeptidase [Aneurinibacillus terranovensis]
MGLQKKEIDSRTLIINVYISQTILLFVGLLVFYLFCRQRMTLEYLFGWLHPQEIIIYGTASAALVVLVEVIMAVALPYEWFDDGGLNQLLFRNMPYWHIAVLSVFVGISEEILFRGVIQSLLGIWISSAIFALIHVRYLKKWVMLVSVILISLLFGWLFIRTGTLWTVILAHSLVDFVLGCFTRRGWFVPKKEGI